MIASASGWFGLWILHFHTLQVSKFWQNCSILLLPKGRGMVNFDFPSEGTRIIRVRTVRYTYAYWTYTYPTYSRGEGPETRPNTRRCRSRYADRKSILLVARSFLIIYKRTRCWRPRPSVHYTYTRTQNILTAGCPRPRARFFHFYSLAYSSLFTFLSSRKSQSQLLVSCSYISTSQRKQ